MESKNKDCPHCGRCPTCGRKTGDYVPWYPYPYINPWTPYPYTWDDNTGTADSIDFKITIT